MENIKNYLENKNFQELKLLLSSLNIADIAAIFEDLEKPEDIIILFRLLSKDVAADVFAFLDADSQETIITALKDKEISAIFAIVFAFVC